MAELCTIAAAAMKPPPPQPAEIVFPKVAGSKADRLPLIARLGTPTDVVRVDVAYAPPVEASSEPAAPQKAASPPLPRVAYRHWHDPHDRKFLDAAKQKASSSKLPMKTSADRAPKRVTNVKECCSDVAWIRY
jgi:hypothetical protein